MMCSQPQVLSFIERYLVSSLIIMYGKIRVCCVSTHFAICPSCDEGTGHEMRL